MNWTTMLVFTTILGVLISSSAVVAKQTINYKYVNGQPLQIDVFDYSGAGGKGVHTPAPAIIYIHGGGWELFSKNDVPDYVNSTAQAGNLVLVSVQYRLTAEAHKWGGVDAITWPAQGEDCLDAVQYVHEHATALGIDRDRMACWGGSAGGHLCAYTALKGSDSSSSSSNTTLRAAAVYYPPTNILELYNDIDPKVGIDRPVLKADSFESLLLGSAKSEISLGDIIQNRNSSQSPWPSMLYLAQSVDPEMYISARSPQMLIAHGTRDHTVPFKQGLRLATALSNANRTNIFLTADGCDHAALPRSCWQKTIGDTANWLYKVLK
eukprot:scpid76301/ scgid17663/ AB hydrolase superfamily protein C1039.03